ncbi:DUF6146 family protein [Flavobacterium humi]|uniref:Lipoprotein n=1 Tax=Flavobacterium humi TaxID=2562683 RepID=A0A4Z0LBZ9_9FLAO|nr:DUF6146 family protein [Flavobacterium humi]TGD59397.1 hypothetical protein E4635_00225 [Flavobacterium humi]
MKRLLLFLVFVSLISCKTQSISTNDNANASAVKGDTVTIANKDLEYEVTIIDPGFSSWLASRSYPRGYHSELYLEDKNRLYVSEWNNRALQPSRYNPNLYEMQINYDSNIHYGYEVNYLIYNYMVYFQNKYNQRLFGIVPPR